MAFLLFVLYADMLLRCIKDEDFMGNIWGNTSDVRGSPKGIWWIMTILLIDKLRLSS